ncbi:MAG: MFS transporter [Saccharospirillum sp.]|nr:MFS transporter [Saccharospirillum sp.]
MNATDIPPQRTWSALWRPTATYYLLIIGIGMVAGIIGPALPFLAEQSNSTMSQIAILFAVRAMGNIIGSIVSGQLFDRFHGHRVLLGMITLAVISMVLLPASPLLWLMALTIFVLGFAEVSMNAGSNVMIMWWYRDQSGPMISGLHFCFGVGGMIVPLLVMLTISSAVSVIWAFWLVAIYLVLIGILLAPQGSPISPANDDHDYVEKVYDRWVFLGLVILFGLYVGMEITFVGWITTYGVLSGLSQADSAFLVSIFWFSLSVGRLLAIPILRRGHTTALIYSCLSLCAVVMLALYTNALPLTALAFITGLSMSAIFPTLFTLGNDLVSLNGRRTGLIFFGIGLGAMAAPTLAGSLIEKFGTKALPLWILLILAIMGIGLALIVLRQRRCSKFR